MEVGRLETPVEANDREGAVAKRDGFIRGGEGRAGAADHGAGFAATGRDAVAIFEADAVLAFAPGKAAKGVVAARGGVEGRRGAVAGRQAAADRLDLAAGGVVAVFGLDRSALLENEAAGGIVGVVGHDAGLVPPPFGAAAGPGGLDEGAVG